MKEEEKLLKVNLSNEQEKESIQKITGFRLYFFRALFTAPNFYVLSGIAAASDPLPG